MKVVASPRRRRARAGFLLNELLIAIGIFAVGMAALASLFPVAALLQRETTREVSAGTAADSARALVQARPLTFSAANGNGDLFGYHTNALVGAVKRDVVPLASINANLLTQRYTPADRSYPSALIDPAANNFFDQVNNCELFWVPFVQDLNGDDTGNNQNWVMRIFILNRDTRANYSGVGGAANPNDPNNVPKVLSAGCTFNGNVFNANIQAGDIQAGDVIMDSNGIDYIVTEANGGQLRVNYTIPTSPIAPTRIWYAPPYNGSSSPAQRVMTVNLDVSAP